MPAPLQSINAPRVLLTLPYLSLNLPGPQLPAAASQPPWPQQLNSSLFDTIPLPSYLWSWGVINPNRSCSNKSDSAAAAWLFEEMGEVPRGLWRSVDESRLPIGPFLLPAPNSHPAWRLPAELLSTVPSLVTLKLQVPWDSTCRFCLASSTRYSS